uniref:Uncharacterized protein n=1 Tax=Buteo japonicus TaxID=224669 RepID=A0A8C0BCU8_9AVES
MRVLTPFWRGLLNWGVAGGILRNKKCVLRQKYPKLPPRGRRAETDGPGASRITRTTTPSSCRGWARTSPSSRWPTTSSRSASLRQTRRRGSP